MSFDFIVKSRRGRIIFIAVLVMIVSAFFVFLRRDIRQALTDLGRLQPLSKSLTCSTERLSESLLQSRLVPKDDIQLLVSFSQRPTNDVKDYLATEGVTIHLNTWIFDYLVADTTVDRLCFLAELPGVTQIALSQAL